MKMWAVLVVAAATAWAADYRVVMAGLGGEPDYEARFKLAVEETRKLTNAEVITGQKAALKAALDRIATKVTPEDSLTLFLVGHGTFDGLAYKFNVVGPDLTAEELRAWLDKIKSRQLVVLATSCSGGAMEALKAPNRVVITATKSGTEKNAVVFSRYWVEALRDPTADTDKNESVSAAEAFLFAKQKTATFYETQKRIATEHPLIDDEGIAGRVIVAYYGTAQKALNDPAKRQLLVRREELEGAIDKLKFEKAAMPIDDYKKQLNDLLVQLAKVQEDLDK